MHSTPASNGHFLRPLAAGIFSADRKSLPFLKCVSSKQDIEQNALVKNAEQLEINNKSEPVSCRKKVRIILLWCGRPDLNRYGFPHAPQTCASAYSATTACRPVLPLSAAIPALAISISRFPGKNQLLSMFLLLFFPPFRSCVSGFLPFRARPDAAFLFFQTVFQAAGNLIFCLFQALQFPPRVSQAFSRGGSSTNVL